MTVFGEEVLSGGQNIAEKAAKLTRSMIVSCGSIGCVATMALLDQVQGTVPYDSIARIEGYGYRLKVFERLQYYANQQGLETIEVADVARYFGGRLHIDIMCEHAGHAGLARFLGEAAGLITHILLPLEENVYRNAGREIVFEDAYTLNPRESGIPCFHLGVIINVPIEATVAKEILAEQAASPAFVDYLAQVDSVVRIPNQYYQALNCLATGEEVSKSR